MKHTPEPWTADGGFVADEWWLDDGWYRIDHDRQIIAVLPETPHVENDARLIAAAPELLDMLDEVLTCGVTEQNAKRARALIAKARGEPDELEEGGRWDSTCGLPMI